jgi:hypothetical protein
MIYAIVGTDTKKREKAQEKVSLLGSATAHIYSEHIASLEALTEASSLFGDKVIVNVLQVMESAASRDELIRLLPAMEESENIFIVDEPFADANRVKRLEKYAKEIFDAREEKARAADPFALCNAFAKRDKKQAWLEWMALRDIESPEAIQGALWWKFQTVWADVKSGRPGKFTLAECEEIGRALLVSSIEAHRGEKDLKVELERIVLSM